ncbi:MAG: PEP-utilizing enzyme [Candidatus Woesearchaeota archaeon]
MYNVISEIKKLGLAPATKRNLSLYTLSFIALTYVKLLKKEIGVKYLGAAGIGNPQGFNLLLNEKRLEKEIHKILPKADLTKVLKEAYQNFLTSKSLLTTKTKLAKERLKNIHQSYSHYILSLGVYNCFWRYLGNDSHNKLLSKADIQIISKQREEVGSFYPLLEKAFVSTLKRIRKRGELLSYLTCSEMKIFLNNSKKVPSEEELSNRRRGYVYLLTERKEFLSTKRELIQEVEQEFFSVKTGIKVIKGHCACQGKVQGTVFKSGKNIPSGSIFVTHMTHPKDTPLLKKVVGIVTDEGGILCHAAIIAREMNIPCIVGTKFATKILKEGDVVEVDATNGTVKILK